MLARIAHNSGDSAGAVDILERVVVGINGNASPHLHRPKRPLRDRRRLDSRRQSSGRPAHSRLAKSARSCGLVKGGQTHRELGSAARRVAHLHIALVSLDRVLHQT